jgi:hypothetical protein
MMRRPENILAIAALSLVIAGCLVVIAPFLSAVVWAIVVCFSTWGVYERFLRIMHGKTHFAPPS